MTKNAAAKRPSASKTELRTIEAIRAHVADTLKDRTKSHKRYDTGFRHSLEEFGRILDPAGYNSARPITNVIVSLQKASAVESKADLRSVEGVRDYLKKSLVAACEDPSDSQYLYGYEDANRMMWRMLTPEK